MSKVTIDTICEDALLELEDYIDELAADDRDWFLDVNVGDDRILEIGEGVVPIMTATLLEVALGDLTLAHTKPACLGVPVNPTADEVLKGAILQRVLERLWTRWHERVQAADGAVDADTSAAV
jgi:hypothetical protein